MTSNVQEGVFADGKGADEPIIEEAVEIAKEAVDIAVEAVKEAE